LGGVQIDRNKFPALQRNAAQVKGDQRVLPKPIVIKVLVSDQPARALLDSGSLGDFMSAMLADQLDVRRDVLPTPLSLQLAVQGSRSKINATTTVNLKYQGINEECTFDIANINNYDLILGTPWMYQHQVCLGFNPARIIIGSEDAQPVKTGSVTKLMVHAVSPDDQRVEKAREELLRYADPLCKEVDETELPPFRAINHTIPLIDENKTYPWCPSRCPEISGLKSEMPT
jgi:Retroviral aspartyl protease